MTFQEAREELKKITGATRYRCMYYALSEADTDVAMQSCRIYVGYGIWTGNLPSWELALNEIRERMSLSANALQPIDGQPK